MGVKINQIEERVLQALVECGEMSYERSFWYFSFSYIMSISGVDDRKAVRRACRALARKGLAQYSKGLWDDEGPAGSGYAATKAGKDFMETGACLNSIT